MTAGITCFYMCYREFTGIAVYRRRRITGRVYDEELKTWVNLITIEDAGEFPVSWRRPWVEWPFRVTTTPWVGLLMYNLSGTYSICGIPVYTYSRGYNFVFASDTAGAEQACELGIGLQYALNQGLPVYRKQNGQDVRIVHLGG